MQPLLHEAFLMLLWQHYPEKTHGACLVQSRCFIISRELQLLSGSGVVVFGPPNNTRTDLLSLFSITVQHRGYGQTEAKLTSWAVHLHLQLCPLLAMPPMTRYLIKQTNKQTHLFAPVSPSIKWDS